MNRAIRAALLTGAAFALPSVINRMIALQARGREPSLSGESVFYDWPLGRIAYRVRGSGPSVVLLHGIGAGESAFEWRHNIDALADRFQVFALDLPGFGESERRNIPYTADLYCTAVIDFLRDVVGEPASLVASSLTAAYAVQTAWMRPSLVQRLALVCPTGLESLRRRTPVLGQAAYGALSVPAYGESIYNGIASRSYIEKYATEHMYVNPTLVTPALVDHYYRSAHQPGARFALRSFMSGMLTCDISDIYARIEQPILVAWGRHARISPVEQAIGFIEGNSRTRLRIFERSGALPHDEEATDFNAALLDFLETPAIAAEMREAADALRPTPTM